MFTDDTLYDDFVFDFTGLREIFHRYFQLSECFNIDSIEEVNMPECNNVQPDVLITIKLRQLSISKGYIGKSHLCCCGCSVLIDACGYDFRGTNTKFEIKWEIPSEIILNEIQTSLIVEKFKNLKVRKARQSTMSLFDTIFESRTPDICKH